ncbi:hypothetical protein ACS0TY_034252 [Phlomoides rotata]
MKLSIIVHAFCSLCFAITTTLAISLSKPGCPEKCGNVTIPYPFGVGSECSANSSFALLCHNFTNPPTIFLSSIQMEVLNISLFGTVTVNQAVSPIKCSVEQRKTSLPISLKRSPFTISPTYNSLAVLSCKIWVWLLSKETTVEGTCTSLCDANSTAATGCNGVNCCQTEIPPRQKELQYAYKSYEASNNGSCGYVFPVERYWLENEYKGGQLLPNLSNPFVPLVLEWEFGEHKCLSNDTCRYDDDYCRMNVGINGGRYSYTDYMNYSCYDACSWGYEDNSDNGYDDYVSSTSLCTCLNGYEGNPYLPEGCIDKCINSTYRSYTCDRGGYFNNIGGVGARHKIITAVIIISSVRGGLIFLIILLGAAWKSSRAVTKFIKASRRHMFFKRNGGLLLEQHLSATQNGLERTKLFTSLELARATDYYNENRILGRGGQGTVYKGMLVDGKPIAVKKSKRVEDGDLEVFINEVVILSQVNHRNVVKLLGCCLETEVPRLVYEFIPNGTLFQHIHYPSEELPLTWEMRLRIAREVAGALAYLHSSSSAPIYHRDIKSTNILLDDKYRAKVADFGTSRSVSIDQTHLTTRVVGTFGYMDPEYFRSSQFTEKSDVYSFGVVMVELLTGEKAISAIRVETGRGLATHFLHSMEGNQLFEILDARVLEEGKKEEITGIAELARRCLNLNGRRRPTMKDVSVELEGIQMLKEGSECNSIDFAESDDFSSISGSMHFDSITTCIPDEEEDPLCISMPHSS